VIAWCLPPRSALAAAFCSGLLRIGFVPARPWCYESAGELRGYEVSACRELAGLLGADAMFVPCTPAELTDRLLAGQLDLCVGGLVEQGYADIRCVRTARLKPVERACRYRHVFFPTVWWIPRDQLLWFALLWTFMAMRRLRIHLASPG
jgi:ABC-type amino acid transport substrate-binding protein